MNTRLLSSIQIFLIADCTSHFMANTLPLHRSLSNAQEKTVASMEQPSENSEPSAGSLPTAGRKDTFSMLSPPSPDSEQSHFGMHASPPPESEDGLVSTYSRLFLHQFLIFTGPWLDFSMLATLFLSPDFGMDNAASSQSDGKSDFMGNTSLSPSDVRSDFGMRRPFSPSDGRSDFGMVETASPSSKTKSDFGMCGAPSPGPGRKQAFGMLVSPSPQLSLLKSDFGMRVSLSPEPQDDPRMPLLPGPQGLGIHQPMGTEEPLGSSSKMHSEFHIANSYTRLILVSIAWKWGELAPSLQNSKQEGQPSTADHTHEFICCSIHIPIFLLITSCFRMMIPALEHWSYVTRQMSFKRSMPVFPLFMTKRKNWAPT
jgi:hypothetical protein